MKARKMISSFEKGRLMSLLLFLLVSVTMQAENPTSYGISVGNVQITSENASNVFNDAIATVSFDAEANTLTLNDAMVNGPIRVSKNMALTVHLVGDNTIDGGYTDLETGELAFEVAEGFQATLTFTTDEENPGLLVMRSTYRDGEVPVYYSGFAEDYPTFSNNLASTTNDSKCLIAMKPVITPAAGLYWTDTEFSLTGCKDAAITYKDYKGAFQEMTEDGPFTLIKGKYFLAVWETVTVDETEFTLYGEDGIYIIHNKPTFTPAPGSYDEQQTVQITNLPSDMSDNGSDYPQVWYYLNDDKQNETQYPSDGKDITITETTKVSVYFVDEDSSNVKTSDPVEAQYVIRQEPGYHFSTSSTGESYINNGSSLGNLEYGSTDNVLPWLINVPEGVTISYGSEDADVASISETGEITLTGAGYVWITASSAETDLYKAHVERIRLEIRPSDPTISLEHGIYYTGEEVTLTATVPNGTMYYKFGENGELHEYNKDDVIELPKGDVDLYAYTRCGAGDEYMQSYGNGHTTYFVYDKPTFSVDGGTYDETQNVTIGNLPTDNNGKVYYYFYDETLQEEDANMIEYHANDVIKVTESSILKALVARVDTGKQIKTEPVEAEYVIRQKAGLQYSSESADYTIGGENNQELPVLTNENKLPVTYSSDNTNVATVNASGEVTIVGMGVTTITATSAETAVLLAGEASYTLTVYKDLNHSDIQVTLSELTYNGKAQTPTVTVKDGETKLTLSEQYSIIEPEAGNTNAILATAEDAPYITLVGADAQANYYVGSREVKFGIAPKQLEEDMVELSATTLPYSGENQKPTVTVSDGELMTADDYTVTNEGGVAVGEYTITIVAKNNYTGTVEKTFEIVNRTLEVGKDVSFATGQKWASYYTTMEDLELPEGVMAYIVTAVATEAVTVKAINYVPKDVPVLIEKESTATTENTSAEGNLLQGTTSAADVTAVAGTVYVLYNNGFTRAKSGSIPAGRAYLVLAQAAGARLSIFEETTGIDASLMNSEKRLVNDAVYDMLGRKVINSSLYTSGKATLKKGMYIVNGQKVVIK